MAEEKTPEPASKEKSPEPASKEKTPGPASNENPEAAQPAARSTAPRQKRSWKSVTFAKVFIQSSFNNTIVTIADDRGNVLCWASSGMSGFKGTKKGTPFAAQMSASKAGRRAAELGVRQVAIFVRGPGPGRETAIRALEAAGLRVVTLKDVSAVPHNGCRPPKARRV
ncbi:MAG: 30S ribosomal protein S11 [Elusimicrobiota bacterium]